MELEAGSTGERFLAVGVIAHEAVNVLVTAFMVLKVLFKLEGLATVGI
jgi:hypothetical protein